MANYEHAQERCPSCGQDGIQADGRYGNRLKRNAFLRRAGVSLLVFVAAVVWIFLEIFPNERIDLIWVSLLVLLAFALTLLAIIRTYRQVYGLGSVGRYPEVWYTCGLCRQRWTSEGFPTAVAHNADASAASGSQVSQKTTENLATDIPAFGSQGPQGLQPVLATGVFKLDWGNCLLIAVLLVLLGVLGTFVLLGLVLSR